MIVKRGLGGARYPPRAGSQTIRVFTIAVPPAVGAAPRARVHRVPTCRFFLRHPGQGRARQRPRHHHDRAGAPLQLQPGADLCAAHAGPVSRAAGICARGAQIPRGRRSGTGRAGHGHLWPHAGRVAVAAGHGVGPFRAQACHRAGPAGVRGWQPAGGAGRQRDRPARRPGDTRGGWRSVGRRHRPAGRPDARRRAYQVHGPGGWQHRADVCRGPGGRTPAHGADRPGRPVWADLHAGTGRYRRGAVVGPPGNGPRRTRATWRPGRSVQKPRSAAPEPGRFHPAHRAARDVGRRARHAGTGGSGPRGPLAGIPAGRGAVLRGHGWVVCPGAARSSARRVAGRHGPHPAGAGGPGAVGGQWRHAHAVAAGLAAVRVLLRFQCAGGQPAQPGLAHGPAPGARRGPGHLQHPAVAGPVCGRRPGRRPGQVGRCAHPVCRDRGTVHGVAGAGLGSHPVPRQGGSGGH